MSRAASQRIRSLVLVAAGLGLGLAGCGGAGEAPPELILITADRIDLNALACFEGAAGEGSSLCRLGGRGTRFAWAFAPSPDAASGAASALTGRPPSVHGVSERGPSFLRDELTTVAETLRDAGYATAAFVGHRRLGRLRRLDQGFELYREGLADEAQLAEAIERWRTASEAPRFLWIQLPEDLSTAEVDRVLARLGGVLDSGREQAGVLVAALRGAPAEPGRVGVESHRIPILWRPPPARRSPADPPVSYALVSLLDVAPTLLAAAGRPLEEPQVTAGGLPLDALQARVVREGDPADAGPSKWSMGAVPADRFVLLHSAGGGATPEVGIASGAALYVRRLDQDDGSGRPVPTSELTRHGARFLEQQPDSSNAAARVVTSPWHADVLRGGSPVPRLEFHLARMLREAREAQFHALPRPARERD